MLKKKATRADIEDFRDWLASQSGGYDPGDPNNCLVCQYLKACGLQAPSFHGTEHVTYTHGPDDEVGVRLPKTIAEIAYGKNNMDLDKYDIEYTFEAARKRAKSVLRSMA